MVILKGSSTVAPANPEVSAIWPGPFCCALWAVLTIFQWYARNEHECSAKPHLQSSGERWRIHVPVPHPGDDPEFDKDDGNCNPQGQRKIIDKKREGVANASQRRHGTANQAAYPRVSASRETPVIGQRLRKAHADPGSQRCSHSDQERVPAVLGGQGRRKHRGQSRN